MSRAWYIYNGTGSTDDVDSYVYANTGAPGFCFSGRTVCAVYATFNELNPNEPLVISSNLQVYISDGIQHGGPRPSSPFKHYVYFKNV